MFCQAVLGFITSEIYDECVLYWKDLEQLEGENLMTEYTDIN